jgi:hypothetical protein
VKENFDPSSLVSTAHIHHYRGVHRQHALEWLATMLKCVTLEVGRVNLVGLMTTSLAITNNGHAATPVGGNHKSVSLFAGMQLASASTKLGVSSKYESMLSSLLSLLACPTRTPIYASSNALSLTATPSTPAAAAAAAAEAKANDSPSSFLTTLFPSSGPSVSTTRPLIGERLVYASKLLALNDVFGMPFRPHASTPENQHAMFQVLRGAVSVRG